MTPLAQEDLLAVERSLLLLGPLFSAIALVVVMKPKPRQATAAMVGFLWQLPALLLLHLLAIKFGWWRFDVKANALIGLPIDVWLGWALWWGPVAVLISQRIPIAVIVVVSIVLDLIAMPTLKPLVTLGDNWLVGEIPALALCLLPGLFAAKLTREDRNPKRRAMFHVLGWGGYMVLLIPVCVLAYERRPLADFYAVPEALWQWPLIAVGLFLLFVGVAATAEFARMGDGTPIPYDPPKRVVSTGPYAVVSNPMQIICAAFMGVEALYGRSWGLALIAVMFVVFDAVYAAWYNRAHIARVMPDVWRTYKEAVPDWRFRWAPYVPGPAEIVIGPDGPSHRMWVRIWPWFSKRLRGDITLAYGERPEFRRLVYRRAADGVEEFGTSAAGRVLEHGPMPLAVIGWLIRFPYLGGALHRLSGLIIFLWRKWALEGRPAS